ncbi:uncharacterized protein B0J16DRAFT_118204 [Fusarium flagelliforme]|uniref:Nacht and wd40 protein n=1 Tax=Fusarium flagelliforme TaxID=2675880 RepID=A0A395MR64_9HYPO|nr:uncharacterized protein B0J16DRAFT_118204 [Fusarium flagelliforme]KAH7189631.1 hypothetical protein B0J16DRAFT_118204 [Fusarium flagelliforme]RFN50280.1 nacht and wd40 protein [Fusarium flagelliforme]
MLKKKETLTIITPIPGFIPRQLAIDLLHSHSEIITLNPLVLSHKPIPAPRNAAADEYYSTWYEITERIQYLPGLGKMGSGKLTFNGCFHDMPWGMQSHIYIPLGIDMRNKYRIMGNQPGIEPPEQPELGLEQLGAPKEGLYLRTDVDLKANITLMGFVKAESRKASVDMVNRMVKKAELLDAGLLKAMFQDGKLKTYNPNDRSEGSQARQEALQRQATGLPDTQYAIPRPGSVSASPGPSYQQPYGYQQPIPPQRSPTYHYANPDNSGSQYPQSPYVYPNQTPPPGQYQQQAPPVPPKTNIQSFPMELPGDYYHPQQSPGLQPSPGHPPANYRNSTGSYDPRWSQSTQSAGDRNSAFSQSTGGYQSPAIGQQQNFAAELPSHNETSEEHKHR